MTTQAPRSTLQARGITLIELLLASVLGLVVLVGIGQIDVTRITMGHDIRGFSVAQMEASYGLTHMVKQLEDADRIDRLSASNLQFRIPLNTINFDDPANYVWRQYKHNAGAREIRFYDPASSCTLSAEFHDVETLTITQDATDINELEISIASTTPVTGRTTTYTGQVTIRGGSGVATGLAPPGVSEPPADCP